MKPAISASPQHLNCCSRIFHKQSHQEGDEASVRPSKRTSYRATGQTGHCVMSDDDDDLDKDTLGKKVRSKIYAYFMYIHCKMCNVCVCVCVRVMCNVYVLYVLIKIVTY